MHGLGRQQWDGANVGHTFLRWGKKEWSAPPMPFDLGDILMNQKGTGDRQIALSIALPGLKT